MKPYYLFSENTCSPPPTIPHASVECNNLDSKLYPKKTVCKYICDAGYVIPVKLKKFKSKLCTSKLKWKPLSVPTCKSMYVRVARFVDFED